jgi:hypothetical protein
MEGWTMVHVAYQLHQVEFIKSVLESNNIYSVVVNKQDSVYLIGAIELYVRVEDAFNANQIIRDIQGE